MADIDPSNSDLQERGQDRTVKWYNAQPTAGQISDEAKKLLETYSGVPQDKVIDHVIRIREKAWDIFPYPCIGQFRFLDLSLNHFSEYPEVLQRLHNGEKLLDMACCFGQEIRQLVADGAPAENIYGCDLREEYIKLGYELFLDGPTLKANFLTADIFDNSSALTKLKGELDIIYTGSFFHLFGYEDQVKVSKLVASLLRPKKGSTIMGRQVGSTRAEEKLHTTNASGKMFRHNVETFQQMWKEIGDDLGVTFAVTAKLQVLDPDHHTFHTPDTRRIWFVIRRQ